MGETPHSSVEPISRDVAEIICQEHNISLKVEENTLDIKRRVLTNKESVPLSHSVFLI